MRIGIDARLWNQTGVGRYIRNLVTELRKIDKKNEYTLFVRNEDYDEIQNSEFKIQNHRWQIVRTDIKWHTASEQIKFASILNKQKLDLVHFPYFSVPVFYNRPFVVTIHDLIINHFPTGKASTLAFPIYKIKLFAYKLIIKKAAQKAKKIITVSNATKEEIIDHLKIKESKIEVIYEAADLAISHQPSAISRKYGKYFLYVGNAYPHKNLEKLIQAFNSLKDLRSKTEDLKLILVGKKDYFYQRLEKENKSDRIVFFGKATDDELSSLYSNAIALVAPSLMEGFGLPVLEAMSLKCLVVASDISAFREIAQDEILYFNPTDINDISRRLKDVAENENKYKMEMLDKAFEKTKNFSWEKSARETLRVYEETLSSS